MKHLLIFMGSLLLILQALPASAQAPSLVTEIAMRRLEATAGDWITVETAVTNLGTGRTSDLIAHVLIASANGHVVVDPEDWAPERTIYLPGLGPGETLRHSWRIHVLIEGEFVVSVGYLSTDGQFQSVVTPALVLAIAPDDILPLNRVIPVAALVPLAPLLLGGYLFWGRRWEG